MESKEKFNPEVVTDEELDNLINYGPQRYKEIGSPPIYFAGEPFSSDAQFLRGNAGGVVYCKKEGDSMESVVNEVFATLLDGGQ